MRIIPFLLLLIITTSLSAQDILWSHRYGDSAGAEGRVIVKGSGGGMLVAGRTQKRVAAPLTEAGFLLHLDMDGGIISDSAYAFPRNMYFRGVIPHDSDGYFVVGYTHTWKTRDVYLARVSSGGNVLWENIFDDTLDECVPRDVRRTADGGFMILVGRRLYPLVVTHGTELMKFDREGKLEWDRICHVGQLFESERLWVMADGGYVVASGTHDKSIGIIVQKFTSTGDSVWIAYTGDAGTNLHAWVSDVVERPDGGLIVSGGVGDSIVSPALFYLDDAGNVERDSIYSFMPNASFGRMEPARGGGYLVLLGGRAPAMMKLNDDGGTVWSLPMDSGVNLRDFEQFDGGRIGVVGYDSTGVVVTMLKETASGVEVIEERRRVMDLR